MVTHLYFLKGDLIFGNIYSNLELSLMDKTGHEDGSNFLSK